MTSHLLYMMLFSFLVALVFALLLKDQPRDQLRFGAMAFGGFMLGGILLGWLMYPFPW